MPSFSKTVKALGKVTACITIGAVAVPLVVPGLCGLAALRFRQCFSKKNSEEFYRTHRGLDTANEVCTFMSIAPLWPTMYCTLEIGGIP